MKELNNLFDTDHADIAALKAANDTNAAEMKALRDELDEPKKALRR